MSLVRMYSTRLCPYCMMARRLLKSKGVEITEIPVDGDPEQRRKMGEVTGRWTVPQIFIGERHVGGFDDIHALDQAGQLDPLLKQDDN